MASDRVVGYEITLATGVNEDDIDGDGVVGEQASVSLTVSEASALLAALVVLEYFNWRPRDAEVFDAAKEKLTAAVRC